MTAAALILYVIVAVLVFGAFELGWWLGQREGRRP